MRRILPAVATAIGLAMVASAAQATVFTLDSIDVHARAQDPGLIVQIAPIYAGPQDFDLAFQDMQTADLFTIYTTEASVNGGEDTDPYNISVDFNFSAPTPNSGATVNGSTYGARTLFGVVQNGVVTWNGPAAFTWGADNSGLMTISLNGGSFNTGLFGLGGGARRGLVVTATFDWDRDPTVTSAPVPEPASWALMIGGFGLAGAALRRRRIAVA